MDGEKFDVALSFSENSKIIAKDISLLLKEMGYKVYYYDETFAQSWGNVDDHISEVYENSRINVVIFSEEYRLRDKNTITYKEKNVIWKRHIKRGEHNTLFFILNDLNIDKVDVEKRFKDIIHQSYKQIGIYELRSRINSMLITSKRMKCSSLQQIICHPKGEEHNRSDMSRCQMFINPNYDRTEYWKTNGDIQVDLKGIETSNVEFKTLLIPSGNTVPVLSNIGALRHIEENLKLKKKLSIEFIKKNDGKPLYGYCFTIKSKDGNLPYVYSAAYDDYLNNNIHASE